MSKPVILSADSTCDLGPELKEELGVHFYPFHIIWRGGQYQDNVDITTDEIFAGYFEDGSLPQTSAINEREYIDYFQPFIDSGYEVVHLNLGSAISSAHENALKAAGKLPGVYTIDSQNLSTGISLQLLAAARWVEEGFSAAEVANRVEGMRLRVRSSFILDTLDFMAAGGRCPSIMAHVTKALSFRPQIVVNNADGSMRVGRLYRGSLKRVLGKYVDDTLAQFPDVKSDHAFITHTATDEVAEGVREHVAAMGLFENIHVTRASCTIGSHCGPNTLGILFVTKNASAT